MFLFTIAASSSFALADLPAAGEYPPITPRTEVVPAPQVKATVSAGDEMLRQFRFGVQKAIVMTGEGVFETGEALVSWKPGDVARRSSRKNVAVAGCFERPEMSVSPSTKRPLSYEGPCFLDDDGDGFFDRIDRFDLFGKPQPLPSKIGYAAGEAIRPLPEGSIDRRIVFLGTTADTIRFGYREMVNGTARPAFAEEITLPIGGKFPQRYAVKEWVFTVFEVNGMGITFSAEPKAAR